MSHSEQIDLNCDLGELEGDAGLKLDLAILPWIHSANVACGAHAGSRERMKHLADACRDLSVAFGAHPGSCELWPPNHPDDERADSGDDQSAVGIVAVGGEVGGCFVVPREASRSVVQSGDCRP